MQTGPCTSLAHMPVQRVVLIVWVGSSIDTGMLKRVCWRHMRWLFHVDSSPETVAGFRSVHDINPLLSDVVHVGSPVWLSYMLDCFCMPKIGLACRHAVVGRNCRFLQGPQTDQAEVKRLRDAMTADPPKPITVKLLNYRVDGQPFWNNLHVAPIRSACGEVSEGLALHPDIVVQLTGSDKTCVGKLMQTYATLWEDSICLSPCPAVHGLLFMGCCQQQLPAKVVDNGMCIVQVIFFVGVQLDITMPPTPKAAAPANAAARSLEPAEAAPASACAEQGGQQTGVPESPAASQQAQSQVCLLCCTGTSTGLQAQCNKCSYTGMLLADLHVAVRQNMKAFPIGCTCHIITFGMFACQS